VTADELKLWTKQLSLRVIRLVAALPKQLKVEQLLSNSFAPARRSLQIIVLLVALGLGVTSLPKWAWFLRTQMNSAVARIDHRVKVASNKTS
jgi:hypothetical protein